MPIEHESIGAATGPDPGLDWPSTEPDAEFKHLDAAEVVLPPAASGKTRADAISLVVAGLLHVGILAALLAPVRGLGVGGLDMDAIGVEIVTMAPALESRDNARGRSAADGAAIVAAQDGDEITTPEQSAARDRQRAEASEPTETAPPPAEFKAIHANPPRAVAGLAGQASVKVEFAVSAEGRIGGIRVVQSMGSPHLDAATVAALGAARVPPPPPGLSGEDLLYDMVFTFH